MKRSRTTVLGVGVLLTLGTLGCATKKEIAELRAKNAELQIMQTALRDSLMILWRGTTVVVRELAKLDPPPIPRPCPPNCWVAIAKDFPAAP